MQAGHDVAYHLCATNQQFQLVWFTVNIRKMRKYRHPFTTWVGRRHLVFIVNTVTMNSLRAVITVWNATLAYCGPKEDGGHTMKCGIKFKDAILNWLFLLFMWNISFQTCDYFFFQMVWNKGWKSSKGPAFAESATENLRDHCTNWSTDNRWDFNDLLWCAGESKRPVMHIATVDKWILFWLRTNACCIYLIHMCVRIKQKMAIVEMYICCVCNFYRPKSSHSARIHRKIHSK